MSHGAVKPASPRECRFPRARAGFEAYSAGIKSGEMLKAAWEIALEKHETHEDLSQITSEYLEHVALLEECWNAIRPHEAEPELEELAQQAA